MIAGRLNAAAGGEGAVTRYVALAHTEGCGVSSNTEGVQKSTLIGYLTHPNVRHALILEHGCEKTHNDYMHQALRARGLDPEAFGWASIQRDGGIDAVMRKAEGWFAAREAGEQPAPPTTRVGVGELVLGIVAWGEMTERSVHSLAGLVRAVAGHGGTVIAPEGASFLPDPAFSREAGLDGIALTPTLGFAQRCLQRGFHVMASPSAQPIEVQTALGACGVHLILAYCGAHPTSGNPLIPVLQWTDEAGTRGRYQGDFDGYAAGADGEELLSLVFDTLDGSHRPRLSVRGDAAFQIARGRYAVSL
jgi:altronate dehydratase